jgi:photosystem II stability/assembly factor-like uncharacterized protein
MTDSDLERELRDHYSSLDAGPAGRATSRVSTALNGAPTRRWGPARSSRAGWIRTSGAVAMVAAAAVLAVVLVPVWSHNRGPAANPTSTGPAATATYNSAVANARVKLAGITKQGLVWAQLATAIAISTDHGHAWSDIPLPKDTVNAPDRSVEVIDRDHAWVLRESTADPQVFRTSDGGASWLSADLPVSYDPATGVPSGRLSFIDASVGFVVIGTNAEDETVLRTLDGGATWSLTGLSATLESVASDANTLWTARTSAGSGANQLLRVSRDAGATWTEVPLPGLDVQSTCVQPGELWVPGPGGVTFLSATEGYAAVSCTEGNFGTRYYRTTDAGLSWSQIAAMTRPVGIAPVFVDATHWLQPDVAEADLQATADGGKTWTTLAQKGLAGSRIYWLDTRDGTNGAALDGGANGALFLTWDGGRTWQPADFAAR